MLSQGHKSTCRELLGNPNIKSTNNNTTISIVTFYYLQFLQEKNPKNIYDIGCGWNIWSKYIPNIIGIDNISHYAHVLEDYNLDYINKNYKKIESAFSINMSSSMPKHSVVDKDIPITFANLAEYIEQFSSIIKPGGRGYVALPAIVPLITTSTKWFEDNNLTRYAIP
jgi:hypothetical protein